jgi:hypothetical protein
MLTKWQIDRKVNASNLTAFDAPFPSPLSHPIVFAAHLQRFILRAGVERGSDSCTHLIPRPPSCTHEHIQPSTTVSQGSCARVPYPPLHKLVLVTCSRCLTSCRSPSQAASYPPPQVKPYESNINP